jgi:hypothetical protein
MNEKDDDVAHAASYQPIKCAFIRQGLDRWLGACWSAAKRLAAILGNLISKNFQKIRWWITYKYCISYTSQKSITEHATNIEARAPYL